MVQSEISMTNKLNLVYRKNKYEVCWARQDISIFHLNEKLFNKLFSYSDEDKIGLMISLSYPHDEFDILYIDTNSFLQKNNYYMEYLRDMYTILGIVLRHKHNAEDLLKYLEKQYIWKLLKQ